MVEIRIPQRIAPTDRPRKSAAAPRIGPALETAFAAGSFVLLAMVALGVLAYDESPWKLARMMAAIVAGPGALEPADEFDMAVVALGVGTHYALSFVYVLAFAGIARDVPREWVPLAGILGGLALYYANLHGFTHLFPWFAELRTIDTLLAHVVFGAMAACIYRDVADPLPPGDRHD